jgi:hypothetical protein
MKLLWEDIQKYGTKEEVEFLLEIATQDFVKIKSQFVNGPGMRRELLNPEEQAALDKVNEYTTLAELNNWIFENPDEAERIADLFKRRLGQIYKGAFAFAKAKK